MSDNDLLTRLRDVSGPDAGAPPVAAIVEAGRRKALGKRLVIGTLALVVSVPLVWSLWGLAGIGRGRGPAIRSGGNTLTQPLWSSQTRALMESVKAWGPGATFADAPCSPGGTNLTLGTTDSDVLGYVPSCLAVPANLSFTISFTNSVTATNGDPSSLGFSLYESPSDAFILGDRESPWTVTSETEANALFRGDNVSTGKTTRYEVSGLQPGVYYFQDDFHPMAMNGVLIVATAGAGTSSGPQLPFDCPNKAVEPHPHPLPGTLIYMVPGRPQSLTGCRYRGLNQPEPPGRLANSASLPPAEIAKALNGAKEVPPGTVFHCPVDFGDAIDLYFRYADGSILEVRVPTSGCTFATNGDRAVFTPRATLLYLTRTLGRDNQPR